MTLSQVVEKLKEIGASNKFINTTGEGDIYDYVDNGGEIVYPVMWILTTPSTITDRTNVYRISLLFADLLLEDKSNRLTIQSDQMLVARDIVAKIDMTNYPFVINKNIPIRFFQERFDDFTAGVMIDIELTDPTPFDLCSAAF
jgi:hypothetical protein